MALPRNQHECSQTEFSPSVQLPAPAASQQLLRPLSALLFALCNPELGIAQPQPPKAKRGAAISIEVTADPAASQAIADAHRSPSEVTHPSGFIPAARLTAASPTAECQAAHSLSQQRAEGVPRLLHNASAGDDQPFDSWDNSLSNSSHLLPLEAVRRQAHRGSEGAESLDKIAPPRPQGSPASIEQEDGAAAGSLLQPPAGMCGNSHNEHPHHDGEDEGDVLGKMSGACEVRVDVGAAESPTRPPAADRLDGAIEQAIKLWTPTKSRGGGNLWDGEKDGMDPFASEASDINSSGPEQECSSNGPQAFHEESPPDSSAAREALGEIAGQQGGSREREDAYGGADSDLSLRNLSSCDAQDSRAADLSSTLANHKHPDEPGTQQSRPDESAASTTGKHDCLEGADAVAAAAIAEEALAASKASQTGQSKGKGWRNKLGSVTLGIKAVLSSGRSSRGSLRSQDSRLIQSFPDQSAPQKLAVTADIQSQASEENQLSNGTADLQAGASTEAEQHEAASIVLTSTLCEQARPDFEPQHSVASDASLPEDPNLSNSATSTGTRSGSGKEEAQHDRTAAGAGKLQMKGGFFRSRFGRQRDMAEKGAAAAGRMLSATEESRPGSSAPSASSSRADIQLDQAAEAAGGSDAAVSASEVDTGGTGTPHMSISYSVGAESAAAQEAQGARWKPVVRGTHVKRKTDHEVEAQEGAKQRTVNDGCEVATEEVRRHGCISAVVQILSCSLQVWAMLLTVMVFLEQLTDLLPLFPSMATCSLPW